MFAAAGKESLGYCEDEEVYAVLEEDGTEVDEEEYFSVGRKAESVILC